MGLFGWGTKSFILPAYPVRISFGTRTKTWLLYQNPFLCWDTLLGWCCSMNRLCVCVPYIGILDDLHLQVRRSTALLNLEKDFWACMRELCQVDTRAKVTWVNYHLGLRSGIKWNILGWKKNLKREFYHIRVIHSSSPLEAMLAATTSMTLSQCCCVLGYNTTSQVQKPVSLDANQPVLC